jgi:sulfhydrogenase subunit beta (sulfur reductase)
MTEKMFSKETWLETLRGLTTEYTVFVPVKDGDFHVFQPLEKETVPDFDYQNARLSPKSLVYPQSERMFEYSLDEEDPERRILKEAPKEYTPRAVAGIRPCDAHAFQIVKRNFDNPEFRDPWWVQRFESTTLVGLGCNEPCPTCFCTAMGGGPFHEEGLDVLLYDTGETYLARSCTDKGEAFLTNAGGGETADEKTLKRAAELPGKSAEGMPESRKVDPVREKTINDLFDAPFWEEVAFACINCGTCTFLCPTCWCFDIQDEVEGKQGDRIRNWDSCMFPLFTLHGSGHNPRDQKFQRVRQRFMHKLKYYVDKYDDGFQCSGCGRCVQFCPVNIDIREVLQLMSNDG